MPTPDYLRICAEPVGKIPLDCLVCEQRGVSGVALPGAHWRICSSCMNAGYRAGEVAERNRDDGDIATVRHYVVTPDGSALEVVRGGAD